MKYFYGPDTYGAREAIRQLVDKAKLPIRWVDREDIEKDSLAIILDQAASGLFGGQLVVVRDPSSFPKALQGQVVDAVRSELQHEWVVWDRDNPDKRSQLFKALKPSSAVYALQSPEEATVWVREYFPNIDAPGASELARRCQSDRWKMKHELEKLSLVHTSITRADIEREVPPAEVADEIFPFLDALTSGDAKRVAHMLDRLLAAGNSELYILSMLGYQYKTLLAVAAGKADGLHPYVIQKNKAAARRYSVSMLQNILARLAATDFAIKQGKIDQRTALIMLTLSLSQSSAKSNLSLRGA